MVKTHRIYQYLKKTPMLDYSTATVQALIKNRHWANLPPFERILQIYNFVRDEILFGYNASDRLTASQVLADGYGQCNTKGTLFMALLRAVGIPCRVHGFTIDKVLQKGAMTSFVYQNAPVDIFHSWVEVYYENTWYELEGFIIDRQYLTSLQAKNSSCDGPFCGYGVAVKSLQHPQVDWRCNNTYIQSEGINHDFGVFDCPDELLKVHGQTMGPAKEFLYRHFGRHLMNHNVKKLRGAGPRPAGQAIK